MAFQGMDVDQVKGEYTKLNTAIGELEKQMGDLTSLVGRLVPDLWKGTDANNFQQDWNGTHKSALNTLIQNLKTYAKDFNEDIQEQERISLS